MTRVRVIVADDEPAMRKVLADLIARDDGLDLVGMAEDAEQAVELAAASTPDVALLDVKMPGGGGPSAARRIRRISPATRLIALSAHEDALSVQEMLAAGIGGYLVKGAPPRDILEAIHASVEGQARLSPQLTAQVLSDLGGRLDRDRQLVDHDRAWHDKIEAALAGDGLAIVYQPIVDLASGEPIGVEALARFSDGVGPDSWFAEAARLGLGPQLELAAVEAALQCLRQLPAVVYLSLNLSPETVVLPTAYELLAPHGDRLVVEITEHARVHDYPALRDALARFREAGVRVAVDDAGAGYASLRHILRLAPEIIKLDTSLTRGIESDRQHRALASALVTFAHETDATITAEGVETAAEAEALRVLGLAYGQGYLFCRPTSLDEALAAARRSPR